MIRREARNTTACPHPCMAGAPTLDRTHSSFAVSAAHLFLSRPWIKPEAASEHNWTKVSPTLWYMRLCAFH